MSGRRSGRWGGAFGRVVASNLLRWLLRARHSAEVAASPSNSQVPMSMRSLARAIDKAGAQGEARERGGAGQTAPTTEQRGSAVTDFLVLKGSKADVRVLDYIELVCTSDS